MRFFVVMIGLFSVGIFGCQDLASERPVTTQQPKLETMPVPKEGFIKVQHLLVSFAGKIPGKPVTRTQDEAKQLADELLQKAKDGADFAELVRQHSDDSPEGIYIMSDNGVDNQLYPGDVISRGGMVKGFGDTSFSLEVGEFGMAEFDSVKSPYGWHIIKRLE